MSKIISRKIIISVCAGIMLMMLYGIIFNFSAQDAEQSGSLSRTVTGKWVDILNTFSGREWDQAMREEWIEYFEHPVRKLAHFTEYACMGILVYVLWSQWLKHGKRFYLFVVIWVALSAAVDEFHQIFVPGRDGNIADVCLDTCGGAAGMLFCILVGKIFAGCRKKRMLKNNKQRHGS